MAHHLVTSPSHANPRPSRESSGRSRISSGDFAPVSAGHKRANKANITPKDAVEFCVARFLRSFQALCVASRLYQKNHPLTLSALETVELHLRAALERVSPVAIGLENDVLVYCPAKNAEPAPLEINSAWTELADNWKRRGIRTLLVFPRTNLAELDAFSRMVNQPRSFSDAEWSARLAENRILGIRVNDPLRQRPTAALATLVSVLSAQTSDRFSGLSVEAAASAPTFEDLSASLRLLAQLESIIGPNAQQNSQRVAESIRAAVLEAESRTVRQLLRTMSKHSPKDSESADKFLARLSEYLLLETLVAQFIGNRLAASDLRGVFLTLSEALVRAADANADTREHSISPGSLDATLVRAARALVPGLPERSAAAAEFCAQRLHESFWD